MANAIYQLPTDNVAPNAALTLPIGTADPDYPIANLANASLALPAKLTTPSGAILFTFNAAQRLDLVAIGPHNLDAGIVVHLQGNASDSWGAPTFDQAITIPAAAEDGARPCPWLDLTTKSGYTTAGFQYWRLWISGTNSVNVAIAEMWLGALKRSFAFNFIDGPAISDERWVIEHETDYGLPTVYDLQVRRRRFHCLMVPRDPMYADMLAWHRAMRGRVYPGLFVPFPETNDAWWVRLTKDLTGRRTYLDLMDFELDLEEVPAGIPL